MNRNQAAKVIFLTTLIDLLFQIIFIFVLLSQHDDAVAMVVATLKEAGISMEELPQKVTKLINIEEYEKKVLLHKKKLVEEVNNYKDENQRLRKENDELRAKVKARGGLDYPPCWITQENKPTYLLSIEIREDGLWVKNLWHGSLLPQESKISEVEQKRLTKLGYDRLFTAPEFKQAFESLTTSNCRHYVLVSDSPETSKRAYQRQLLLIEQYSIKS